MKHLSHTFGETSGLVHPTQIIKVIEALLKTEISTFQKLHEPPFGARYFGLDP